jgi:uncharacterized cupredoxin-like copper-binding protein
MLNVKYRPYELPSSRAALCRISAAGVGLNAPLFVFNQLGDLERPQRPFGTLLPGGVRSWRRKRPTRLPDASEKCYSPLQFGITPGNVGYKGVHMISRTTLFAAAVALLIIAAAPPVCAAEPTSVKVTLSDQAGKDMRIILSKDKVKAGAVEFKVTNASTDLMHEFLITPWRGAITSLPYDAKRNAVAEDKLPHLQGVEDMPAGTKATVRLVLTPGEYVVFCNQTGHYKMGMEHRFTVTR